MDLNLKLSVSGSVLESLLLSWESFISALVISLHCYAISFVKVNASRAWKWSNGIRRHNVDEWRPLRATTDRWSTFLLRLMKLNNLITRVDAVVSKSWLHQQNEANRRQMDDCDVIVRNITWRTCLKKKGVCTCSICLNLRERKIYKIMHRKVFKTSQHVSTNNLLKENIWIYV